LRSKGQSSTSQQDQTVSEIFYGTFFPHKTLNEGSLDRIACVVDDRDCAISSQMRSKGKVESRPSMH